MFALRRRTAIGLIVLSMVATVSGSAHAHYVYERQLVYTSEVACVQERSEVSHGNGGGYVKTDVRSLRELGGPWNGACESRHRVPAGWIAAMPNLFVLRNGQWSLCYPHGNWWYFNKKKVSELWAAIKPYYEEPHCGDAHYGNSSFGFVWSNNEWVGGGLWSGTHWLD